MLLNDKSHQSPDNTTGTGRPHQNVGTYKDGPAKILCLPIDGEDYDFSFHNMSTLDSPVMLVSQHGLTTSQPLPQKLSRAILSECSVLQTTWTPDNNYHGYLIMDLNDPNLVNNVNDPHILSAHISSSKYYEDNPSFNMAVNGPWQAEYWEAMQTELQTIAHDFKCWSLVLCTPDMHVLPLTWAFKVKQYPDRSVKKFKVRFCARGDKQLEGIDYFETWAPVVQWSTIRIIMIITVRLAGARRNVISLLPSFMPSSQRMNISMLSNHVVFPRSQITSFAYIDLCTVSNKHPNISSHTCWTVSSNTASLNQTLIPVSS